jgi:hypothetical protein
MPWASSPYVILGDDIVIKDIRLGNFYLSVIESLGMDYSKPKTHISASFFEFSKRLFFNGVEISPFPISGLRGTSSKYYLFTSFLLEQINRNWSFTGGVSAGVTSYLSMVKKLPSRFTRDIKSKSLVCELIIKIIRGDLPASDLVIGMKELGYPVKPFSNDYGISILQSIARVSFAKSNPASDIPSKNNRRFGDLALQIVLRLSGYLDHPESTEHDVALALNLITSLPICSVHGQMEEL